MARSTPNRWQRPIAGASADGADSARDRAGWLKRAVCVLLGAAFLCCAPGCPRPDDVPEAGLDQLLEATAEAAGRLDPGTIKAILRRAESHRDRAAAMTDALERQAAPRLTVNSARSDLILELGSQSEGVDDVRINTFTIWVDEVLRGQIQERGDVEGFKAVADRVVLRAGKKKRYLLTPHFQTRGRHTIYCAAYMPSLDLEITLYRRERPGGTETAIHTIHLPGPQAQDTLRNPIAIPILVER